MSLKAFHVAFIFLSTVLAAGLAAWCLRERSHATYLIAGIVAAACAVGLTVYGIHFVRKTKGMGYL